MGSGALRLECDDFNGDNFDHSKEKFLHGAGIHVLNMGSRPIQSTPLPEGTPSLGCGIKKVLNYNYTHNISVHSQGASLPQKQLI